MRSYKLGNKKFWINSSSLELFKPMQCDEYAYEVTVQNQTLLIKNKFSFLPIYVYESGNQTIVSNGLGFIKELSLNLTLNKEKLEELVLFNTTLSHQTHFNELKRIVNVESIAISDGKLSVNYNVKHSKHSLFETFISKSEEQAKLKNDNVLLLSGGGESRINASFSRYMPKLRFVNWGNRLDKEYIIASKIAKKLKVELSSIQPRLTEEAYESFLKDTLGFINPQYLYRTSVIKEIGETSDNNTVIWTGWGDLNGFPNTKYATELFSDFYIAAYNNKVAFPRGFQKTWFEETGDKSYHKIKALNIFDSKREIFGPLIFGQVLSYENNYANVYAPWFTKDIYEATKNEEMQNPHIIKTKRERVLWKADLYYRIIQKNYASLNRLKNSKGYPPFILRKKFGIFGVSLAYVLNKFESKKRYQYNGMENRDYIFSKLNMISEKYCDVFDFNFLNYAKAHIDNLSGTEISFVFRMIQIHYLLENFKIKGK